MSTVVHFVALYAVLVIQVFCAYGLIKYLKMKVSTEIHFKENSEERTWWYSFFIALRETNTARFVLDRFTNYSYFGCAGICNCMLYDHILWQFSPSIGCTGGISSSHFYGYGRTLPNFNSSYKVLFDFSSNRIWTIWREENHSSESSYHFNFVSSNCCHWFYIYPISGLSAILQIFNGEKSFWRV